MSEPDDHPNHDPAREQARRFLIGALDEAELQEFSDSLQADPAAVKALVQSAFVEEVLHGLYEQKRNEAIRNGLLALMDLQSDPCLVAAKCDAATPLAVAAAPRAAHRTWVGGTLAAALVTIAAGFYLFLPREIVMVTQLAGVRMADDTKLHVGSRLKEGQRLQIAQGFVELTFDRGTVVAIKGPADFQIVSDLRARSLNGRVSVDVGERSTGFTIETPSADIVDWGTQFGVAVDGPETDIVVFDGVVDLHARGRRGGMQNPQRLTQGEALRVSHDGRLHRIISIDDSEFPVRRPSDSGFVPQPFIASVADNVRAGVTNKCYRVVHGGFGEDVQAYVDRRHQWNGYTDAGLPPFLIGGDYVMPFNEDKRIRSLKVTVTMAREANLYLLYDSRTPVPRWLRASFQDTGMDVGLDEGSSPTLLERVTGVGPGESIDVRFRVWKRAVHAGERLFLGPRGNEHPSASVTRAMFTVVATSPDI